MKSRCQPPPFNSYSESTPLVPFLSHRSSVVAKQQALLYTVSSCHLGCRRDRPGPHGTPYPVPYNRALKACHPEGVTPPSSTDTSASPPPAMLQRIPLPACCCPPLAARLPEASCRHPAVLGSITAAVSGIHMPGVCAAAAHYYMVATAAAAAAVDARV